MITIGWATRDLTPDRPVQLQGQKYRRIAHSTLDPITVTAWVFDDGDPSHAAALVSLDVVSPPDSLIRRVRETIASRLRDLPAEQIVLLATHTHSSLLLTEGLYEPAEGEAMSAAEGEQWVAERAGAAVIEAWENRRPRAIFRAFGRAVVGHHRYAEYADGSRRMYGKTHREDFLGFGGGEDHSVDLLFAKEKDGRLAGIALAIPCPSQVSETNMQISADYWHEVRLDLRRRYGEDLSILPFCAAAGDLSPHVLLYDKLEAEMRARRGLSERQEIARRVGEAVALAVEGLAAAAPLEPHLAHAIRKIDLAPRAVSKADRDWAAAEIERSRAKEERGGIWFGRKLQRVLDLYDGKIVAPPVPAELHAVRIGDFALATNPFELFLDYALQIKARSPAAQTAVLQLAGNQGYLPSERAIKGGGYGVNPASSQVGPEGGRQLVEQTLSMLEGLFPSV
ncbi:MAG: hypothetical protein HUU04_02105 [Verrucomicrobiae bacterium]|nr:hypothetical protein [Verrucomicrobiae bacterium]